MLETVEPLAARYEALLMAAECAFTVLFTVEYLARLVSVERPFAYARSFFGLVDLASVLPMYLTVLVPDLHVLIDIRLLRMLRVFRILKLTAYMNEYSVLGEALVASHRKIVVFLATVAMLVVVLGTVMYVVEGPAHGFTSIPVALYWAITTMTTIGSDLSPGTALGRAITAIVVLIGLSGYMGKGTAFEEAIADFSAAYAGQNDRDYNSMKDAIRTGRVEAVMEQ